MLGQNQEQITSLTRTKKYLTDSLWKLCLERNERNEGKTCLWILCPLFLINIICKSNKDLLPDSKAAKRENPNIKNRLSSWFVDHFVVFVVWDQMPPVKKKYIVNSMGNQ